MLTGTHSLGWVAARRDEVLVGFVNVLWEGLVHAWIQDELVSAEARHRGIGLRLIEIARDQAKAAGCEWDTRGRIRRLDKPRTEHAHS
jgi:GNAT superfamily N-acetyltransferase